MTKDNDTEDAKQSLQNLLDDLQHELLLNTEVGVKVEDVEVTEFDERCLSLLSRFLSEKVPERTARLEPEKPNLKATVAERLDIFGYCRWWRVVFCGRPCSVRSIPCVLFISGKCFCES